MADDPTTGLTAGPPPVVDLLAGATWECASTRPDEVAAPDGLDSLPLRWLPATVPGTAAAAVVAAGQPEPGSDELDRSDWWFRCAVEAPAGDEAVEWVLDVGGLATVGEVWWNGEVVSRSTSMFERHRATVTLGEGANELHLRCAALAPLLAGRRPRPRWKTKGAGSQQLRWFRTTLLGRQPGWAVTPAPVGPWRPVRLTRRAAFEIGTRRVVAACTDRGDGTTTGTVTVELSGWGEVVAGSATLEVAGAVAPLQVHTAGGSVELAGAVTVDGVERWWPHTHGPQPLYPVAVAVGDVRFELGSVGFRTVEADRRDDGFQLRVNGVEVFARGACWYPPDPVSFAAGADEVAASLGLARDAGMNLLRIPGGTVYADEAFYAACDRLGVLVWQDAMLAFLDPPDDPEWTAAFTEELGTVLTAAAAHPSLAVVCGGQELEEQAAMFGLPRAKWQTPLLSETFPALTASLAPGVPTLPSSPTGGSLPFQPDAGVSHYTGVGVFLRPLDDLRRAAPRFVSEGIAFSIPPDAPTVDRECGGASRAGHDPEWKQAIHHDTGGSWDLEDVRDHYVGLLFGVEPALVRRTDPERALDLGRAAVCEIVTQAVAEWRRPGSPCAGLVLVALRDLRMGAGWGLLDAAGQPKAPWFAFARGSAPVAVLATDEGLNGLHLHLVNDTAEAVTGTLTVELASGDHVLESASRPVDVPARGGLECSADALFDGFRDLAYAYRFGPRAYELVTATLTDPDGRILAATAHLPDGPARPLQADVGLQIGVEPVDGSVWSLSISTRSFAQFVCVEVPGYHPEDSWFHLAPGTTRVLRLTGRCPEEPPRGRVRALNSLASVVVTD